MTNTEVCCICGNFVTSYSKSLAKLDTPWGKFSLYFHKACDIEDAREKITAKLREIALEHKP